MSYFRQNGLYKQEEQTIDSRNNNNISSSSSSIGNVGAYVCLGSGQRAVTTWGWVSDRRSDVALAMRQSLWVFHLWALDVGLTEMSIPPRLTFTFKFNICLLSFISPSKKNVNL